MNGGNTPGEDLPCPRVSSFAGIADHGSTRRTMQQTSAENALEISHALRDASRRNAKLRYRADKTPELHHLAKDPQIDQIPLIIYFWIVSNKPIRQLKRQQFVVS